jgi:hypothetical protein
MAASTPRAPKPRRPRGKALIALFTAAAALAGGAQALTPAPAAAVQDDAPECVAEWLGVCVLQADPGSGGSSGDGSSGGAKDGSGRGSGRDPDRDGGDTSGKCSNPSACQDAGPGSGQGNTLDDGEAAWKALDDAMRKAEEWRQKRDTDQARRRWLEDSARRALRDQDPDRDIWKAGKCGTTEYPLRCGVFWIYVRQRAKCWNLPEDEAGSPDFEWKLQTCRNTAIGLSDLLQNLVELGPKHGQRAARND